MGDPAAVTRLVDATIARFGRLDVLVNNAALRDEAPFAKMGLARWHTVRRSVPDGAFFCSQAALQHWVPTDTVRS